MFRNEKTANTIIKLFSFNGVMLDAAKNGHEHFPSFQPRGCPLVQNSSHTLNTASFTHQPLLVISGGGGGVCEGFKQFS